MAYNVRQGSKNESVEVDPSFSIVHRKEARRIVIDGRKDTLSVAVLADGKHVVSNDSKGEIRRWRIEDGTEVGTPMHAGSTTCGIAVSRDGKLIVSGTMSGVTVWNAQRHSKVTEFMATLVNVVDVSPDGTKIVTGSHDNTACVWSLSTGKRLLDYLEHDYLVVAARFSPDGRLIATATTCKSVRVHSRNGNRLVLPGVAICSPWNHSLAWAIDSAQLFVLSLTGHIHRVDVSTGTTLSKWLIDDSDNATSIALASNGTFIAASTHSSVSFWDTASQEQIGTVVQYTHNVWFTAMSSNYDFVTGGPRIITIWALCSILPSHYLRNTTCAPEIQHTEVENFPNETTANPEQTIRELRNQLAESEQTKDNLILSLRAQEERSNRLEKTVQELRNKHAESQCEANQEKNHLNKTINTLRVNLRTCDESSSSRITHLEQTNEELRVQLSDARWIIHAL